MLILNSIDPEILMQLHQGYEFPLPDLTDKLYISKKSVIESGKITAIGLVRLTAEGILITNDLCSQMSRARCSEAVINALRQDVKRQGLTDCHVFVRETNVQKFLRHLGFSDCKGGQAMVIQL